MRTTIVRIVFGLLLLTFVACNSDKPPKPNPDAFDPNLKPSQAPTAPKPPDPNKFKGGQ